MQLTVTNNSLIKKLKVAEQSVEKLDKVRGTLSEIREDFRNIKKDKSLLTRSKNRTIGRRDDVIETLTRENELLKRQQEERISAALEQTKCLKQNIYKLKHHVKTLHSAVQNI